MRFVKQNNLELAKFENLNKFNDIEHFVTTRHGGVSSGTYESFNLNLDDIDANENVLENRSRLAKSIGLNLKDFVFPHQVHGTQVVTINEVHRGKGAFSNDDVFDNTDGFVTNVPRLCIITKAADCVPIVFFDPIKKAIGVAHAGWKGTALKIPAVLVDKMKKEYGTNPNDLIVGIGPSGGPCCYEVGEDVIAEVSKKFEIEKVIKCIDDKTVFDMWEANKITLLESGVKPENIEISEICTITQNNKFFSARKGDGGRFVAGIFIL
jgi:polyphenol oxidase